ncbi:MAG: hypothetical protein PHC50_01680 [Candidatus Cloacimonetes bacterium]|nr:hypothetical protein [Candidatus Cloacimonadota bacterium]
MQKQEKRLLSINLFNFIIANKVSNNTKFIKGSVPLRESTSDGYDLYSFKFHQGLIVFLLMLLWGLAIGCFLGESHCRIGIEVITVSAVTFVVITYAIACIIYSICQNDDLINSTPKTKLNGCCQLFLFIASPSWFFAHLFKSKLMKINSDDVGKTKRCGKTQFIAYLNRANLIASFVLAIVAVMIYRTGSVFWFGFIISFVVLRTLSRSFEITIAFGKDTLEKNKSSKLKSHERLLLAFTSLFESVLNYSVVYWLLNADDGMKHHIWRGFVSSFQSGLFYSNSYLDQCSCLSSPSALAMLQLTQVITCMTLVFVAFAIYISNSTSG